MRPVLEVKNLRVSFRTPGGRLEAVRDISFCLERGKTLALVGESGSGKSVTSRTLMGLLAGNGTVDAGEILFGGRDLLKLSEKELCGVRGSGIAMVFQDPMSALNPVVKVGKQITEALLRGKKSVKDRARAKEQALRLMEEVGIPEPEHRFHQYPFQFSGGMRQRIVIAVALASDPEVLICDEPTTALDVTIQAQILELINNLKRQRNLSVLFITHDLGVVAGTADMVAVMYAGKIVEYGTVEELFTDPRHPYTWALLSAVPDLETTGELETIIGSPPDLHSPPEGDAFAPRNPYAMKIDYLRQPPPFWVSDTHWAATWLLHPSAPEVKLPQTLRDRIEKMRKREAEYGG